MTDMTAPRDRLSPAFIEELHERALEFADTARALVNHAWASGFTAERKADGSFVTNVDLEVEDRLRQLIRRHYPDHGVLGEEFPPARPGAEFQWIIDPIDGTEDFVHRVPTFGSIFALYYQGEPVVGILDHPALAVRCHAAYRRGTWKNEERVVIEDLSPDHPAEQVRLVTSARANYIRYRDDGADFDAVTRAFPNHRIYRSCYGHTLVATGGVDAMVDYQDTPWDIAACRLTTEEAGGVFRVVRQFMVEGTPIYSTVFGKRAVVERLCALLGTA